MTRNKCFIIAEAGVNHNGKLEIAYKLCDAAKASGADAVKFQTWVTEDLITRRVAQADYQRKNIGKEESQFEMLKNLEMNYENFRKIKLHCDDIGITFMSTPCEAKSLDFLTSIGVSCIKIGSGDVGNVPFLRYAGSKKLPVILSSGMSTLADIDISLQALREGGASDIILLHCTTNYPCPKEDVNLRAMLTLGEAFKLPYGYSDHTQGIEVSTAAAALGASIIEKHFTLDHNMEGPDHIASTEPEEFKRLVDSVRNVEACLGTGIKTPTAAEKKISKVVLKRIVAKVEIPKGHIIAEDDICVKRSSDGLPAKYWDMVIGKPASCDYTPDDGIKFMDV